MKSEVWGLARRHWFYLALPLLLIAAIGFRATHPWREQPGLGEAVTLFDWCVFVPILYTVCYREMPGRALVLRALALVCGGIWLSGQIVPGYSHDILSRWGWLRNAGIAVLVVFEGMAAAAMLRVVFGAAPDPSLLARQGVPPLLVKFMLAEARFWRSIWSRLRGR